MTLFGRRDRWALEVEPLAGPPLDSDPAATATWCALRIWAGGRNLTAHSRKSAGIVSDALYWPAVYFARWLVRSWPDFWERAGWPLPSAELDAEAACHKLDEYLAEIGPDVSDELLERRDAFVASHALVAAAAGGVMPNAYIMREGSKVHVSWRASATADVAFLESRGHFWVTADEFLDVSIAFLEWCARLVGASDQTLAKEIDRWLERVNRPEAAEAALLGYVRPWGAGAHTKLLGALDERLALPEGWQSVGARLDPSRFSAAVVFRALAPVVNAEDVLELLVRLRRYPKIEHASRKLEELRSALTKPTVHAPHHQGYDLAVQLRQVLHNPDAHFDVEACLTELGVRVEETELSDATVDAATVWGENFGPVVVLNTLSSRNDESPRRMTLAHELCHLLVDRHAAADLIVASTPWAPPELEKRANAFAAELLLPKAGMLRVARDSVQLGWLPQSVRAAIIAEFEVSATVCHHQLENRLRIGG